MNRTANIQTRINGNIKSKAGKILTKLGLSHSEAINIYYRQIIIRNGIPFSLEIPNEITLNAIEEVESGRIKKSFKDADKLFEDLLK
jgi:DNA-damage-inducible protein J